MIVALIILLVSLFIGVMMNAQRKLILNSFRAAKQINIQTPIGRFNSFDFDEKRIYIRSEKNLKLSFEHNQFFTLLKNVNIEDDKIEMDLNI